MVMKVEVGSATDNLEPRESTLQFLLRKHETLANDYKTPDGKCRESCMVVAYQTAEKLIADGKDPFIVIFSEIINEGGIVHAKSIEPLIYGGRISWGAHMVCCAGDMTYDPMLGVPVSLEEYSFRAFGENISMKIGWDCAKTREVLAHWEESALPFDASWVRLRLPKRT